MKSSDDCTLHLFPDAPAPRLEPANNQKTLPVARIATGGRTPLTKEQKAFNALLKKIDGKRNQLAEWKEAIPAFKTRYVKDLLPLEKKELEYKLELIRLFDAAYDRKGATRTEKKKLSVLILDFLGSVLERSNDEAHKALYEKYAQADFDTEQSAELDSMKAMLEDALGMDLNGIDIGSPESVMQGIEKEFLAEEERRQAQQAARPKTAKQKAREAQQIEEEKLMSQSIREVYRKLVGSLHPDRESDPAEKQRKTELMQQANDAYKKGNLLELLELQLRLEQIDQTHLASMAPQQMKRYTQILKDQLGELEEEVLFMKHQFAAEFGIAPYAIGKADQIMAILDEDKQSYEEEIQSLQAMLDHAGDPQSLKTWLKMVKLQRVRVPNYGFF